MNPWTLSWQYSEYIDVFAYLLIYGAAFLVLCLLWLVAYIVVRLSGKKWEDL